MKLVKITAYYNSALKYYYSKFPHIVKENYNKQLKHLLNFGIGWADFYSKALKKIGWDAYEIVWNAKPLQKQWAKENKFKGSDLEIIIEQIKHIQPDIVWFQDSINFTSEFLDLIKNFSFVKLLIGTICSPFSSETIKTLKTFNFITTCSQKFTDKLSDYNIKSLLLYHAFDPSILQKINSIKKTNDIVFIGSIIIGKNYHNDRIDFLKDLIKQGIEIKIYANLQGNSPIDLLKKQSLYFSKQIINLLHLNSIVKNTLWYRKSLSIDTFPMPKPINKKLKKSLQKPVFGLDMYQILSQAFICINQHIKIADNYAANMRLFETTGLGTLLLTDNKKNINELFEPDKEIIVYKNYYEAAEKIKYLLNNPQKAKEIALAGQKRTFKDHTYLNRAKILVNEIKKYL